MSKDILNVPVLPPAALGTFRISWYSGGGFGSVVAMPRQARNAPGGILYHCFNRGNGRQVIFHKQGDARAFVELIREAKSRVPMRVLAFCLMSNHWHLALWPAVGCDSALSEFMAWLGNAHVRRYRRH